MVVIAIERTQDGSLASATSATLSVVDATGLLAVPTTPVTPTSPGIYSYDASALGAGRYQATWTFSVPGFLDDVIQRVFNVDTPVAITEGVTLADIERLTAPRIGPYTRIKSGLGSTVNQVYAATIKSSLALGSYVDQFILRRGLTWDDSLILSFVADDRVRQVVNYDSPNGLLINDRAWDLAPSSSPMEAIEVHYLDPENELRPAVLDGLRRCFFWDEIQVSLSSGAVINANLTAIAPWLDSPSQVRAVSFSSLSSGLPVRVPWWQPYHSGRSLYIRARGAGVGTLTVAVLRPVYSLVNNTLSLSGPNDDLDILTVNPDYAAWAAVLELWKRNPERVQPMTAGGIRPTLKEVAAEFSKKSLMVSQQGPQEPAIMLNYGGSTSVIGNLAEPV